MNDKRTWSSVGSLVFGLLVCSVVLGQQADTLAPLKDGVASSNFQQMWGDFDPRAEPLEVETIKQWEEDGVLMRIVRFRIGVFKGQVSKLAAVYGIPKDLLGTDKRIPGLVQIHGGGQYADHKSCLMNAKRGYATVSIAWAGRISAPDYRVSPAEVQLFWDGKTDDPKYKLTTDWGAVDGYHAPSRNKKTQFPSAKPFDWTIDPIESPRNSPWFLCAIAARRALTFLEKQPNVDADRLGVYGHSMGGKLTVMASVDPRVKAAAPSCGGISDRGNDSELFKKTIGDDVSLREITCPIVFQSPANDFHGRIGDLPRAIDEIKSQQWAVTCSPHHNHQDTDEYEVASLLWFDHHLKGSFQFPATPKTKLQLNQKDGIPTFAVQPDQSRPVVAVDVFYTQQGKEETRFDIGHAKLRFWHHADASQAGDTWTATMPLTTTDKPLWVYANITYALDEPVAGAGYYYGIYNATKFNVSSLLKKVSPQQLVQANVKPNTQPSELIESFDDGWQKEWFSYKPENWPRATHKIYDAHWRAPQGAKLALRIRCETANKLVVLIDGYAATVDVGPRQDNGWQDIELSASDFRNLEGDALPSWDGIGELKLSDAERLRPARGSQEKARIVGKAWQGKAPEFRDLRWKPSK